MNNKKGQTAREKLIGTAAELFIRKGYNHTGINDILGAANMSKGSFYFYFSSKKSLALEVAEYYGRILIDEWLISLPHNNWSDFVNAMVNDLISFVENEDYYGCPLAVLGLEIAFLEPDLAAVYTNGIKKLIDFYACVLENSGVAKDDIERLARRAFAISEGHMLYYRISKEEEAFKYLLSDLLSVINQ